MSEYTEHRWVYVGRRMQESKLYFAFLRDGQLTFWSKSPPGAIIGGTYAVEANAEGNSAKITSAKLVERDHENTLAWRLEDQAAKVEYDSERELQRLAKENTNFGEMTFAQFRAMYHRALPDRKRALLASALTYFQRTI